MDEGVLIAPLFVGLFCTSVGAHSTAQSWHTDPLTRIQMLLLGHFQSLTALNP